MSERLYEYVYTQREYDKLDNENAKLRAEIERLKARVSKLVTLLDDQHGTPCEQIRHQQEVERLRALLKAMLEAYEEQPIMAWFGAIHAALAD